MPDSGVIQKIDLETNDNPSTPREEDGNNRNNFYYEIDNIQDHSDETES